MRHALAVGVWKDRLTFLESLSAAATVSLKMKDLTFPFETAIAPTPIALVSVQNLIERIGMSVCAQNVMWKEETGSYIGETTIRMLSELKCKYAIVGHSERRLVFNETDEVVGRKARDCINAGIKPIVCIGDSANDREQSRTWQVMDRQLRALFQAEFRPGPSDFSLAYEPVWAISTWRTAEPLPEGSVINDYHREIRNLIAKLRGSELAETLSILYGGSVNPSNGSRYMRQENVDGVLIGGASKEPASLIQTFLACKQGLEERNTRVTAENAE